MRHPLPRVLAPIPDALTALLYLAAWIAPDELGPEHVKQLMFAMLIEFLVLHSSAAFLDDSSAGKARRQRVLLLCALSALYIAFAALFAWAWDSSWPLFAFVWLFVCRFFHLLTRAPGAHERAQTNFYGANLATFFGAMLVLALPLPRLGLTPQFAASMHIARSGALAHEPRLLITFGATYFLLQAWLKYAWAAPRRA